MQDLFLLRDLDEVFLLFVSVVLSCVLFNDKAFKFETFHKLFSTMSNHMNIDDKENNGKVYNIESDFFALFIKNLVEFFKNQAVT